MGATAGSWELVGRIIQGPVGLPCQGPVAVDVAFGAAVCGGLAPSAPQTRSPSADVDVVDHGLPAGASCPARHGQAACPALVG